MAPKPTLVVVGLGVSGIKVASKAAASGSFDVVSIEPKEFFEIPYSAVRTAVADDPAYVDKTLIPFSAFPAGVGRHIKASATAIKAGLVVLDNGETVKYDYLVVATGATHTGKGVVTSSVTTIAERKAQLKEAAAKIQAAKSIVVVGGGPTGIELVGEIVDRYVGKEVTLVHSGARLLEAKDERFHNYIAGLLKRHRVGLVVSDKAGAWDEAAKVLVTAKGQRLPAEVVLWAAGSKPNTQPFVAGGDYAGLVNERGGVKVDANLRLQGVSNVFVLGDINDTPHGKLGFLADLQADLTVANLAKLVAGGTGAKLAAWAPPLQPKGAMFVTFGASEGTGHLGGCNCGAWFVKMMKGKDLMVGRVRSVLGVKP